MRLPILLLTLLLAGCTTGFLSAPDTSDWRRDNTADGQTSSDLQSCRRIAQSRFAQDQKIQQDMGVDQTSQGSLVTNMQQYQTEKQMSQLVHDCMLTLGYHPASQTQS
jgi:hypothetical protein